ncbi:MAG TPA: exodeoxyribonuclease VII small subunit [Syntrophothermus lipocalidus]|uniref:Exodeoxyribonuclease 7 small subunit n=1 Tax=Syntrophothermus lipocalidus (strain DSM 12680 / TGB-C1) TaxID=643648 RepID=D7CKI1_SYNLT|nr:exodeoxyribonuclease VII small subunit [Syntrophothermus lipocalidus]ADI01216.1 exodeoxyribonuclease VII, small subunit [Syntrophothermus lipocalidus DSM 12680]HHV76420.1 exodeoxyribonuclease VII small subunit [Syntrophothermus lipocalidus]HOV43411.1 exodeoxyribonuclease VII small subunit [Syntrophothermus lipocalidus]
MEEIVSFEMALTRLEEIVLRLEEGNLSLEESLTIFQEGVELLRFLEKKLREAEGRVLKLTADLDSGWKVAPLEG